MTGPELRARRLAMGLSQDALANLLGITQAAISRWEHGRRMLMPKMLDLAMKWLEKEKR